MKQCTKCKEMKDESEFSTHVGAKDGLRVYCIGCNKDYQKNYRLNNIDIAVEYRKTRKREFANNRLVKKYGMSLKGYEDILEIQETCTICGISFNNMNANLIHLDHDHETGDIREFLYQSCNLGLGMLKEDPKIMRNMIEYIEYWNSQLK